MVPNNLNIKAMLYADLILPLAVPKLLTYHFNVKFNLIVGQRVIVNVGKQKQFSALVFKIHDNKPNYTTKPIIEILDESIFEGKASN